jgi:hypothetical protein
MRILLALIASAGLVSCVGDISSNADPKSGNDGNDNDDNPSGADLSAAKRSFDSNVYSIINAKCSGGACHSENAQSSTLTRFVATDAARGWEVAVNYTALVGNFAPATAPILGMIKGGAHHSVAPYTSAEEMKITDWLTTEVNLRNTGQQTPPTQGGETLSQAAERVMSAFAGCMTITNFNQANMANAWGNLQAENNEQCENCHSNGGEGFIATRNADLFFSVVSTKKMYFLQYFKVNLTQGAAAAKVEINTVSFKGVATAQDPHREHPRFNATQNNGMTALTNFYNLTSAAVTAGTCQPKPLQN